MSCKSEYQLTKRKVEPTLQLNAKCSRKHKTERRLTSSAQTRVDIVTWVQHICVQTRWF